MRWPALLLAAFLVAASAEAARGDHGNDSGAHWPGEGERVIPILNALPEKWDTMVAQVAAAWSVARGIDLHVERGSGCAETYGAIVLCPVAEILGAGVDHPNAAMSSRIEYPGELILSGVGEFVVPQTRVRPLCRKLARCRRRQARDFQYVLCHELGHALGLDHPFIYVAVRGASSCMSGGKWPDAHDLAEVGRLHT